MTSDTRAGQSTGTTPGPRCRRILVPVDFSPGSQKAARYAFELGKRLDARVDLLHVWQIPAYDATVRLLRLGDEGRAHVDQRGHAYAEVELAEFVGSLGRPADEPPLDALIEIGDVVEKILEVAKGGPYDLVVMGTHGRTGLSHLLLGSVTEQVLARSPCPVLAVPMRERPPRARSGGEPRAERRDGGRQP